MTKTEEKTESFVRLENANLVKLSIKRLSKLFTRYGNLIIDIKKLRDHKEELKKEVIDKLVDVEKEYLDLIEALPKSDKIKIMKKPRKKKEDLDVEIETNLESFAALREEFERIKRELEGIS